MTEETQTARQGRPPSEDSGQVRVRAQFMLEPGLIAEIKAAAKLRGLTFSTMGRQLILDGLAGLTKPPPARRK